jgi:hypothetical protein
MPSNLIPAAGDPRTPILTHALPPSTSAKDRTNCTNEPTLYFLYKSTPLPKHIRPAMFSRPSLKSGMIRIRKTCIFRLPQVLNTFVKMDLQHARDIWTRDALVQVGSLRIRFNVT